MPGRGRTTLGDQRDPAQPEEVAAVAEDELVHHGQGGEPGEHQHDRLGNRPGGPRGEQQGVHDDEVEEVTEPAGQQGEGHRRVGGADQADGEPGEQHGHAEQHR